MEGLEVNCDSGIGSVNCTIDVDVAIDEDEEQELEAISQDPTGKPKLKRSTNSIVWSHFDNFR